MDKRDFTVIENKTLEDEKQVKKTVSHQTNPIAKKFIEFRKENLSKLSVKDLFKR